MDGLIETVKIGLATAVATTFDDNIYLTAFFSEVNRTFRPKHVVVGEILGFTALVSISLIGFALGMAVSSEWTGLLGILPILIGLNNLRSLNQKEPDRDKPANLKRNRRFHGFASRRLSLWEVIRDPQTYKVSAVTISNGGNNLGIYIPLFASSSVPQLAGILPVCYFIVGCWLLMSYTLTHQPKIALVLSRYASKIFPFVLMWLGFRILNDSGAYRLLLPGV